MVTFQKAVRSQKKLRCALLGPSGAGKTRTALELAKGLGSKIALIDTEHGSASMYAHIVDFDAVELFEFSPDRYIEAINAAEEGGYDVLVIDSLSHAWSGKGGILEFVDRTKKNNNSYNAWGDATPRHNKLVERLLTCKLHLIVTMRTKMEHVQEKDERTGKTIVRKVGMQPVQRDGMEYEFDVICDIDQQHTLTVGKTRIDEIDGECIQKAGADFGKKLKAWLDGGAPAKPKPRPALDNQKTELKGLLVALGITSGQGPYVGSVMMDVAGESRLPETFEEFEQVCSLLAKRAGAQRPADPYAAELPATPENA